MEVTKNDIYIVRYRLNSDNFVSIKEFTSDIDASKFYNSLENCAFKTMLLKTTRVFTTVLLYKGCGILGEK